MPNPSSVGDGAQNGATVLTHDSDSRKRMRTDEVSAVAPNMAANTYTWYKAKFSNGIQQMTHKLQKAISEVQKLYGLGSIATSNHCQNTAADPCRRTSSLVQRKMYGRVDEKNSIIEHITGDKPDGVIVVPIVGTGGIGKTSLAQLVYNEPTVKRKFDYRIWIWVSSNFDEVRLTMEMLDFVSQEKCVGISSLAKLQEILVTRLTSKRTLIILDDVWDDIDDCRWNKLLAPVRFENTKGNVIIVTTRNLSTAKSIGTVEPIKLPSLQYDDFWPLFKTCTFGAENYKEPPGLIIIGRQIANKLQGNPLAAETAGMLLREHLTVDRWSKILKNERWKTLQLNGGIMQSLKLTYDELPFYLQQCFLYCSIFPNNHRFLSGELVRIWISQGFVKCSDSTERLEEIGWGYLTALVNSCFFEEVKTKESTLDDQTCYVMPPLVHDLARLVSRTECAAIGSLECTEVLPTIRHLSILTDSAYREDQYGNILRNMKFEEKLQSLVTSVRKLRSLIVIGKYDSFFFRSFLDVFQKVHYMRALQISATYADFESFLCNSVSSTHLRHLKLEKNGSSEALPISEFYHLQVLDVGNATLTNYMSDLFSMRHLVVKKGVHFMNPNPIQFEMTQLESMNELVHLGVHQLENVNRAEACRAKLRDKQHLEKLHLLWTYRDTELEEEGWPMNVVNNILTSVQLMETARELLEGLEPHQNLKHLQISGYIGATCPNWLSSIVSVTCLQTLHLNDCRNLQVLPSFERLPFLTKLKLRNMWKVVELSIPSLEVLMLIEMPMLEKCYCNSMVGLSSSLRVVMIKGCRVLKTFPLFESCEEFEIEKSSRLPLLSELTIHDCPRLMVSYSLPSSGSVCRLSMEQVSALPQIRGSTSGELIIWQYPDDKITKLLSFHYLWALTSMKLVGCPSISSISLEGFWELISLKSLRMGLFSSDVPPELTHQGIAEANFNALPSLKNLEISSCGITGKLLSVMLRHAPGLEELVLENCDQISGLLIEREENSSSNHTSTLRASTAGNPDDALTTSTPEGLLRIPLNLVSSLKKMTIKLCEELTFQGNKEGFSGFTSLEELTVDRCTKLIQSLLYICSRGYGRWLLPCSLSVLDIRGQLNMDDSLETLQPCFLEYRNRLKRLEMSNIPSLKFLQLHFCTALEELEIYHCDSLTQLEGNLTCLKELDLQCNPSLESLSLLSCTALESLVIDDYSFLTISFCECLTSLRRLVLYEFSGQVTRLTDEQESALQLLTSLQELRFEECYNLADLPVGLHSLPSLKTLQIFSCMSISRLPEQGLPPSLEELVITGCNEKLNERCRALATSKLTVMIDEEYVN